MSSSDRVGLHVREQDLAGKIAVISGASRGIGRATAAHLASRGCSILGTCSSSNSLHLIDSLDHIINGIYKDASVTRSNKVIGVTANIFSSDCAQTIAEALHKHFNAHLDIFVNNATDGRTGTIGEMTIEHIQHSLIANVQTPVLIVEELVKRKMFRKNSRIIYVSSIRSREPWSEQLMYGAGKAAGESLCRTWADTFGGKEEKFAFMAGTTANAVTVGLTQTDAVMSMPGHMIERFKDEFVTRQALPKFGEPEDVADVIGMLCGRDARWITGNVISASGGGYMLG